MRRVKDDCMMGFVCCDPSYTKFVSERDSYVESLPIQIDEYTNRDGYVFKDSYGNSLWYVPKVAVEENWDFERLYEAFLEDMEGFTGDE